jgi:hypothetical protein
MPGINASGFVNTRISSGEVRTRVLIMLTLVPIRTSNFEWEFIFNRAYNQTKVLSLVTEMMVKYYS